jgi:hypothetical protein
MPHHQSISTCLTFSIDETVTMMVIPTSRLLQSQFIPQGVNQLVSSLGQLVYIVSLVLSTQAGEDRISLLQPTMSSNKSRGTLRRNPASYNRFDESKASRRSTDADSILPDCFDCMTGGMKILETRVRPSIYFVNSTERRSLP